MLGTVGFPLCTVVEVVHFVHITAAVDLTFLLDKKVVLPAVFLPRQLQTQVMTNS
jgi:hypothetical protein